MWSKSGGVAKRPALVQIVPGSIVLDWSLALGQHVRYTDSLEICGVRSWAMADSGVVANGGVVAVRSHLASPAGTPLAGPDGLAS